MFQNFREYFQAHVTNSQLARFALSFVLALMLWGWVTLLQDPVETQRYSEIAITPPELSGSIQVVTSLPRATVTLTDVSSVLDEISRADIAVTLDTSEVEGPGRYELPLIAATDQGVREIDVAPDSISVEIEEEISRNFPITVENQVLADDSRRIVDVNPEISEVTVAGTASAVSRITRVVLPVSTQDRTGDFTASIEPYAVDEDNQRVQEVTIIPGHVSTHVELEARGKTVSVVPQVTGTPAEGYVVQQQLAMPSTVIVDGPQELLEDLLFVYSEPVDISGANESLSRTVSIEDLPEGVTLVEPDQNEVEVRVSIGTSAGAANLIPDMPIEPVNVPEGTNVSIDPETIDLSASAPSEILTTLTPDDIGVTVDVSGLGRGVYTLEPVIDVPEGVTVTQVEPEEVVVLVTDQSATPADAQVPRGIVRFTLNE